ncbi:melanopsin-A-like [Coregonus clupeaformis]|uniref:melanopsin-A-like n=1 Tax=Coregonus clupeaformis TaxID=59861 RepID=UPI001E1C49EE|nr:melanopsin-A-like [Coregonus clupeaformis]
MACELYAFCGALFGMTSMMTLLVIAMDRYFVITRPLTSMGVMSRRRALYVMAAAWLYSMAWSLPPFFGWSAYVPEGLMTLCLWDYMTFTPSVCFYTMLLFIFVFFIPLFIIIYCYFCIFTAVRIATRDRFSNSSFMSSTCRSTLTSTTSSLYDSESGLTEAELSSRPTSCQVSSDVTQLHPTFSQRSKGHSVQWPIPLLEDVRKEKSKGVSGRVPSTCLTDSIPAIIVTSTSSP